MLAVLSARYLIVLNGRRTIDATVNDNGCLITLRKLITVLMFLTVLSPAAFELQSVNTTGIALGSISSLYPGALNPAVLIPEKTMVMRTDYSRLFGISGLDYYQVEISRGFRRGMCAGMTFQNLGNRIYQEKTAGFKIGSDIKNVFSVGITLNVYNVTIIGYEKSTAVGLTAGSLWNLNEEMQVSLVYHNINSPAIYHHSDPLPECFFMGVRYVSKSKVEFFGEIFKDTQFPFSLRLGSVLKPCKFLDLRCGTQFNPDRYSGGFSIYWRKFSLDFAIQQHQVLPYTLYYGIGYGFR